MRSIRCAILWMAMVAMPSRAEFEGVLEMKATVGASRTVRAKTYVSSAGWRTEMDIRDPQMRQGLTFAPTIPKEGVFNLDSSPAMYNSPHAQPLAPIRFTMLGKGTDEEEISAVLDVRDPRGL
jgi:hypothetical protein